jgi:hypothetical protein
MLLSARQLLLQLPDCIVGRVFATDARRDLAGGRLQEAAVPTENFALRIVRERSEGLGGVDYGRIRKGEVAEEEGARGVDEAEVDFGVRAETDADLCEWG